MTTKQARNFFMVYLRTPRKKQGNVVFNEMQNPVY